MYPLTIGLAIENRDLMEQAQACLAGLPFRCNELDGNAADRVPGATDFIHAPPSENIRKLVLRLPGIPASAARKVEFAL